MRRHALLMRAEGRLILVLGDLLQDHLLLRLKVIRVQGRTLDVAEQVECLIPVLRQYSYVIDGLLLAGESVAVGAEFVQFPIHVGGASGGSALESHMFQEMADAREFIGFVAGAGSDEEAEGRGVCRRVALGDDLQAVVEAVFEEFQRGISRGFWPKVTTRKSVGGWAARYRFMLSHVKPSTMRRTSSSV